jgi:pimeloyl-ACP methyl ester carboxylesterase
MAAHVEDLLDVIAAARPDGKVTVVGHSFGGVIAIAAALVAPSSIDSVIVYEPPLPWLSPETNPHRGVPLGDDPALEVERFFRHMVSDAAWEHLSDNERADRVADGPAMVGDLTIVRMETPFELERLASLAMPLTIVMGSSPVAARHRATAEKVVAAVPQGQMLEIQGAGHGAHLSHPDRLATLIDAHRSRSTSERGDDS